MNRRLLLSGLFVIGVLNGSAAHHSTYAFFSSSTQSTNNQFSAGTLHIGNSLAAGTTLTMANLLAGDNFDAQLDIANSGSLALRYALTTTISGDATLASTVEATVRVKTTNPCTSRDGAILYPTGVPTSVAAAAFGDPAYGNQSGDRQVAAISTESLCFSIVLPTSATSALLATTFAPTFVFTAEQV